MPFTFIGDGAIRTNLTDEDVLKALAKIKYAAAETVMLRSAHRYAVKHSDADLRSAIQAELIASSEAKLHYLVFANQRRPLNQRVSLEKCLRGAGKLELSLPLEEPTPVYTRKKQSGGKRFIHKPGPIRRGAQAMVHDLLEDQLNLKPFQYTFAGPQQAIKKAKARATSGLPYAAHLDIENFFPSFDTGKLVTHLPLRKELVEHAVSARFTEPHWDQSKGHGHHSSAFLPIQDNGSIIEARLGIPQGAVCSPIVSVFCLSHLAWKPFSGVALLNYADNFLVLGQTQAKLDQAVGKLTQAVEVLPGGQFKLRVICQGLIVDGLTFLGHELRLNQDGECSARVSEVAWSKLTSMLGGLSDRMCIGGPLPIEAEQKRRLRLLARSWGYAEAWARAYSECIDAAEIAKSAFHDLTLHGASYGLSAAVIEHAVDDSMKVSHLYCVPSG